MMSSRVTLATMDAAAIESERESPRTTVATRQGRSGARLPSTSAAAGRRGRAASARAIAAKVAPRMLRSSISRMPAAPTPTSPHASRSAYSSRRLAGDRVFESSSPSAREGGSVAESSITAAATTGPAHGPRPASSIPATIPPAARSRAKSGTGRIRTRPRGRSFDRQSAAAYPGTRAAHGPRRRHRMTEKYHLISSFT